MLRDIAALFKGEKEDNALALMQYLFIILHVLGLSVDETSEFACHMIARAYGEGVPNYAEPPKDGGNETN